MWLRLLAFATGLMFLFLKIFAPLSDPLDGIVSLVFFVLMLTYVCIVLWEERRERQADQSA